MDSFAISIANGISKPDLKFRKALIIAFLMGLFHVLMPIIGYFLAHSISDLIREIDHWIAFFLLGIIGVKMIIDSIKTNNFNSNQTSVEIGINQLIMQSFATSIDALVIGISLGFLQIHIVKSATIIGLITFMMVMIGLKAGIIIGNSLGKKMEFLGGIILIIIGLKILIQHLFL